MKTKTPIRRVGKIGKINSVANKMIYRMWIQKQVTACEYPFAHDCWGTQLTNAHRHKRAWYRSKPSLLWDWNQVTRLCIVSHEKIEYNRELTEEVFLKIRGPETAY